MLQLDEGDTGNTAASLGVLLQCVHQFLDQGKINEAAGAYGIILQLQPQSRPIDLRIHNLWALGAEIIMRQGEETNEPRQIEASVSVDGDPTNRYAVEVAAQTSSELRWGISANISKLKTYFETLIRQHPYENNTPHKISAVDFWLALLSCETYNIHADYLEGLLEYARREKGITVNSAQDDGLLNGKGKIHCASDDFGSNISSRDYLETSEEITEEGLIQGRDEVRIRALEMIGDVIRRMESLMEQPPYSKHESFWRLRATASLLASDLCMITSSPYQLLRREADLQWASGRPLVGGADTRGGSRFSGGMFNVPRGLDSREQEDSSFLPTQLYPSLPIRKI